MVNVRAQGPVAKASLMVGVGLALLAVAAPAPAYVVEAVTNRSEERRVGKECCALCRSRWSPYH